MAHSRTKQAHFLRCAPEQCFWVRGGPVVCSLAKLADALADGRVTDAQCRYHTGGGRNDFAAWVRGVFRNDARARSLARAKKRETIIRVLRGSAK